MDIEKKLEALIVEMKAPEAMALKSSKKSENLEDDALLIIEESLNHIHALRSLVCKIKEIVKGVKWYQFLRIASSIEGIITAFKQYEWKCKK